MESLESTGRRSRLAPIVSLGLLGVVFAGMLRWTWGTWPDVLIDFGQQLYVAWQLSSGKVLGRDLATLHGPLSHYLNALVFLIFGVGIHQLVLFNLAVLLGLVALLLRLLRRAGIGWLAATAAGAVFLLLFAASQYVTSGNYNYVCPYVPEIVHGLGLSLLSLLFLARLGETGRAREAVLAGLCLGLVFLTKAEVLAAAAVALAVGLPLVCTRAGVRSGRIAGAFALGALFPPLVAFGLLATAMPLSAALRTTCGPWVPILEGRGTDLLAFRRGMGTENVGGSLASLALFTLGWAGVLGPAALACSRPWAGRGSRAVAAFVPLATLAAVVLAAPRIGWAGVLRPLPLALGGLLVVEVLGLRRAPREEAGTAHSRDVLRVAGLTFALVLLVRMGLFARLYHYGFVLAMPGSLAVVAALTDGLPRGFQRRGGNGWLFRAFALVLLAVVVWVHLGASSRRVLSKVCPVGSGRDAFLADARGCVVGEALPQLAGRIAPRQTLAVLPEGVMLNYLLRRQNPTPYTNFMPPELAIHGESAMAASLTKSPPDFLVLVRKDLSEWGFRSLGGGYALELFQFVKQRYVPEALFGSRFDEGFGMLLLRRCDVEPPAAGAGSTPLSTPRSTPLSDHPAGSGPNPAPARESP